MYLFLIIGMKGQGKSTWVNKFIAGKKSYVFDVNNEYSSFPDDKIYRPVMRNTDLDINKFLETSARLTGTNIVFEDATGFFRGRQSPALIKQVVKCRHTKNNFLILFHSLNRIPPELLEMSNYVVLYKTIDNIKRIESKFENDKLNEAFIKVNSPNYDIGKYPNFKPVIIKMI